MDIILIRVIWIFISSFLVALIFTPASIWVAKKAKIIDFPGKTSHTIHQTTIARAGGIALIFSLFLISISYQLFAYSQNLVILLASIIIFIFGLWDDRFGMNAPLKLLGQLTAIFVLISNGIRVQFFENPQFFISLNTEWAFWIDIFITFFWILAITNAFNLIDSMDGLALGLAQIITAFFIISALKAGQSSLLFLSSAIFGVCLGVFYFNRFPAKTFLGDSGAQTLGFILSVIAIIYRPKAESQSSTWFIPIIIFGIPIFDTTLVTISRALKGIPIYKANLDHTYHRLVGLGLRKDYAVNAIHIAAIFCGLLAFLCVYIKPIIANIIFAVWLLIFASLIIYFEKKINNT